MWCPSTQSVPADAINSPPHTHSDEGQKELSAVGILPPTFWKETGKAVVAPTVNTEVWPGKPRTVTVCGISYDDLRTLELKKCRGLSELLTSGPNKASVNEATKNYFWCFLGNFVKM